jgi:hypothetical protein
MKSKQLILAVLDELDAEYAKLRSDLLKSLNEAAVIGELDYRILYNKFPHVFKGGTGAEYLKLLLERIDLKEFYREQAELKIAPKTKQKKILQKLKLASSLFKSRTASWEFYPPCTPNPSTRSSPDDPIGWWTFCFIWSQWPLPSCDQS